MFRDNHNWFACLLVYIFVPLLRRNPSVYCLILDCIVVVVVVSMHALYAEQRAQVTI
jgi:hypothetical protein